MILTVSASLGRPGLREVSPGAEISYTFPLRGQGDQLPILYPGFVQGNIFPRMLLNIVHLGEGLPVTLTKFEGAQNDSSSFRQLSSPKELEQFTPLQLFDELKPDEEALLGLAVQVTFNHDHQARQSLTKQLLVRRSNKFSTFDYVGVAEIPDTNLVLERNIFSIPHRTYGVIHQRKNKAGAVIGTEPFALSEYFGWPTNAWDRNVLISPEAFRIRHLAKDLFLGGEFVLEPVVEAFVGGQTGRLLGYDLLSIGRSGASREVTSQVVREFRE